jgi:TonB family protein
MSYPKYFGSFSSILLLSLASCSNVLAQKNLVAQSNSFQPSSSAIVESDRTRDGLIGPVRRVRVEVSKLSSASGRPSEEKRVVLEIDAYDIKGAKTENQYFPVAGSTLTGKEVYKYDDKGNISEMTRLNADGSLLSREVYKYDYDAIGNWIRMTTSVAVVEAGKVTFEPTEVTYRLLTYYLDENVGKMVQPPNLTVAASDNSKKSVARNKAVPLPSAARAVDGSKSADNLKVLSLAVVHSDSAKVVIGSEPPPSPAPKLQPVSGGVLNSNALSLPSPIYPDTAKRLHVVGSVAVDVVIDETGKVISARTTNGPIPLRDAAVQAALKARFTPTKLSGQAVKVTGVINYKFALAQ